MNKQSLATLTVLAIASVIGFVPGQLFAQSGINATPESILHVTGYASTGFQYDKDGNTTFNIGSFSPIFHFLYKDILLMETELEIEAEEDGGTGFMMEYLTLDLFLNDYATLVMGKYLSPLGQFKQNLHPTWINKLPSAPIGFGHGGIVPMSDIGIQLRGGLPMNQMRIEYALSVDNGPQYVLGGDHHSAGGGVSLSHAGFPVDDNNDKVIGGRICLLPRPNYSLAGSFATGGVVNLDNVGVDYQVLGFDSWWRPAFFNNLELRGEYLTKSAGDETYTAYYAQAACMLPFKLEGVIRYGNLDNNGDVSTQIAPGINYLISSNVIAKLAYEINDSDDFQDQLLFQLAYGF